MKQKILARTVAVIEIGSTGIRLLIADILATGDYKILDRATRPVSLGRDAFTTGLISHESIHLSLKVLNGYRELLQGYGICDSQIRVIATSALREAKNRDVFIDRVKIHTGFNIEVVEGVEENHLMYLAVQDAIQSEKHNLSRTCSMILEVGGGSTEIMLMRRGKMVAAHSLRIGTIRLERQLQYSFESNNHSFRFLEDNVRTSCEMLSRELDLSTVKYIILIGSDARLAADKFGTKASDAHQMLERSQFDHFVSVASKMTVEEIIKKFSLSYASAEDLIPGLITAKLFIENTACEKIIVPNVSLREGVLFSMIGGPDYELQDEFFSQVVASAKNLGKKYSFDENHALHVAKLSLELFDLFQSEHCLGRRERLVLHVAAILHDIGLFIRASGHQRHSEYIILNSEIFGIHGDDLIIIGSIVRYHRKAVPNASHVNFMSLSRNDRMIVLKLASLLRVADALDRGHNQRITDINVEKKEDSIIIRTGGIQELSLEKISMKEKSDMFENVFGYKVILS